ncbi:helix-turn-helix domain-containing protein [Segnochrobactrum spirostomi]|uniref:helix-turn-helix domain-containing protein n=1 Tax=Segnochrobactrum spirostomi TaxID=2608987 RepID=UPI001AD80618|nr:helix-turn-helix transcriptional regulator [Segnochrobactrum spirostomi]
MERDRRQLRGSGDLGAAAPSFGPDDPRALARRLRMWRSLNSVKQRALAEMLGVSQTIISFWETGRDVPNPAQVAHLKALMAEAGRDEVAIERAFVGRQAAVRALFDLDGIRLLAASTGFRRLWPLSADLEGRCLADNLVDEARKLAVDDDLRHAIFEGALGLASGISLRHTDIEFDEAVLHRWHICFRRYGHRRLIDMTFEPCDETLAPGVTDLIYLDK